MLNPACLYPFGLLFLRSAHVRVCDIWETSGSSLRKNPWTRSTLWEPAGTWRFTEQVQNGAGAPHAKVNMCVCDKKVSWEKQASDCLLGTNVCANHCQHFPFTSNHCSGNWITPLNGWRPPVTQRSVCLHRGGLNTAVRGKRRSGLLLRTQQSMEMITWNCSDFSLDERKLRLMDKRPQQRLISTKFTASAPIFR